MTFSGRIAAPGHRPKGIASEIAGLVRRQRTHLADHQAACSPFLVPVLDYIGGRTAGLHSDAKTFQGAISGVPSENIPAGAIWPNRVNKALGQLWHNRAFRFPKPFPFDRGSIGEARG